MDNGYTPKSRMLAGLLGIFLGCYGVHNFYLGYTTKGIIQVCCFLLLGSILWFVFGLGLFVQAGIGLWALIEAIMIFAGGINVDGKGYPLAD